MQANDWEADNLGDTSIQNNEKEPGGYDAVNRYGDEYNSQNDASAIATLSSRTLESVSRDKEEKRHCGLWNEKI